VLLLAWSLDFTAQAQTVVRVGEINSFKMFPMFLEPYRKGVQLGQEEYNAAKRGYQLAVLFRDDNGDPGNAVRVAQELVTREKVTFLMGTLPSNVALAVSAYAKQHRVLFFATEPLSDHVVWKDGHRYVFRLRPSTYMQTAMLVPHAAKERKKRWALVYPNYEYGQSAAGWFRTLLKEQQVDVQFVAEQAPALGRIDAGAVVQALADAQPDGIFSALFATDLQKFVREGNTRGLFKNRTVVNLLAGEPEYLDPMGAEAPEGWYVTGYPWYDIKSPQHDAFLAAYRRRFNEPPRLGSVVGYTAIRTVAALLERARSLETEKLVESFKDLKVATPFGPITFRHLDHQSTMGAYVGRTANRAGRGMMIDWHYADGAKYLPADEFIRRLRAEAK
jgi:branched-chain amino acid transport system substrate-binding protein